ncbi:MAG: hypothetical protein BHW64_03955 [Candidatus Melainabacteria bacterium LEY3_CP_29_8]|nr:MAG: hypothetical protein BHW64_03955 [Candidatus Melainabacteria bacterium LEY3_CP_29_8]
MKIHNLRTNQNNKYLNNKLRFRQQNTTTNSQVLFGNNDDREKNKKRNWIIGSTVVLTAAAIVAAVLIYKKNPKKITPDIDTFNNDKYLEEYKKQNMELVNKLKKEIEDSIIERKINAGIYIAESFNTKIKKTTEYIEKQISQNYKNINNGIMITSKTKIEADIVSQNLGHNILLNIDRNDFDSSFDEIVKTAIYAKEMYEGYNNRLLLNIPNLDDFLNDKSQQNKNNLEKWNTFFNQVSDKYHTSIIFSTDKPDLYKGYLSLIEFNIDDIYKNTN